MWSLPQEMLESKCPASAKPMNSAIFCQEAVFMGFSAADSRFEGAIHWNRQATSYC